MKKWLVGGVGSVIFVYILALPYITVYNIKAAVEARDGIALADHVDFVSVRQSLKDQMNAMFLEEMSSSKMKDNPFAALGMVFAGTMIDKMVDAYITPSGMAQLMSGEHPDDSQSSNKNATPSQNSKSSNKNAMPSQNSKSDHSSANQKPLSNATMSYQSLSRFEILVEKEHKNGAKIIMRRNGLEWKITEIILPKNP